MERADDATAGDAQPFQVADGIVQVGEPLLLLGRVWFTGEKVLMKTFWYFDHQFRVLNKV